jgi:hypothetical protein
MHVGVENVSSLIIVLIIMLQLLSRLARLTSVDKMMLLQVRELCKTLGANGAFERPLARVRPKMHFKVRQLAKSLAAHIALVMHLAILLLERIRQRPIASRALRVGTEGAALGTTVIIWR